MKFVLLLDGCDNWGIQFFCLVWKIELAFQTDGHIIGIDIHILAFIMILLKHIYNILYYILVYHINLLES